MLRKKKTPLQAGPVWWKQCDEFFQRSESTTQVAQRKIAYIRRSIPDSQTMAEAMGKGTHQEREKHRK